MINITVLFIGGGVIKQKCQPGCSIQELLDACGIVVPSEAGVFLDGEIIEQSSWNKGNIFSDGSRLIIAKPGGGAAPTPNYKKVSHYLLARGYTIGGGKGGHEKFTAPQGETVVLTRDKRDKKCLDLGSAKSLAKHLNINLQKLYEMIS